MIISPGHSWIDPVVLDIVDSLEPSRVLDLGCGNGVLAGKLSRRGYTVTGVEHSQSGIDEARLMNPDVEFVQASVYDDPAALGLGSYDLVVSEEVIEHLYYPDALITFADKVLTPNGRLIVTTPYYGYLRNLVIALFNRWDHHLTPLWTHGHIKLFSRTTMAKLLERNNFKIIRFSGAGNFPFMWKTMVVLAGRSA
jgi:2-polyprenyl-3-methyl-5-hydroxy-6-metoxy-1,4-benzoquinol methylase